MDRQEDHRPTTEDAELDQQATAERSQWHCSPEDFPVSELSELASEPETSMYDWGNHGSPEDVPVSEVSELASELELEMVMECRGSETGKPAQMAAGTSM